jgi:PilZ domain
MNDRIPSPRKTERRMVEMTAQCRTQSGLRDKGTISDISPEGCCVTTNALFTREGLRVMIKPEGMEGLSGVIRWIEGNKAGVQFDSPLYGPVFDHLCASHQGGRAVSFGRY